MRGWAWGVRRGGCNSPTVQDPNSGDYINGSRPPPAPVRRSAARRAPAAAAMHIETVSPQSENYSWYNESNMSTVSGDYSYGTEGAIPETPNTTFVDQFTEQIANALNVYYTPVLIVLGCFGNFLSIIVFFTSKLRLQSTSQYLSALAFSDTIFLCQLLPPWMKAVEISGLFTMNIFCQVFVYLSYVCSNHSSWLVVAFTVERFVAVVYPLRRNAVCTVKRARHIILTLAASAIIVNLPVLRFAVPSRNDCNIDYEWLEHAARFNLVDTVFSFTLPLSVIIFLNAWIMAGVYRLGRARSHLIKEECGDPTGTGVSRALAWQRSQQRVTRMLLIVSSVFVLLNLPAYTMRIVAYANDMSENEYSGKWAALQQICLLFFNTNFGINFFLYCMTGQNFRRALCQTFPWLRRRARRGVAVRRTTSHRPPRPASVSTSFVSNNTEATTGTAVVTVNAIDGYSSGGTSNRRRGRRRQRSARVVRRWRFDNSRQRERSIEMVPRVLPPPTDI